MALWGVAYAAGPNYNKAWKLFDPEDRKTSVQKVTDVLARASHLAKHATPVEQALIEAIATRFPSVDNIPEDLGPYNRAYADSMRLVYQKSPSDLDVVALFAEALLCITPRGLWDLNTGLPTGLSYSRSPEGTRSSSKSPRWQRTPGTLSLVHPPLRNVTVS